VRALLVGLARKALAAAWADPTQAGKSVWRSPEVGRRDFVLFYVSNKLTVRYITLARCIQVQRFYAPTLAKAAQKRPEALVSMAGAYDPVHLASAIRSTDRPNSIYPNKQKQAPRAGPRARGSWTR
jgi:hypothetical protein